MVPVQDYEDAVHKEVTDIQYARHEFNEQEEFFNKLKGMESSDTELVLEKEKKIGEIKYPIRDRDTAVDCRNNKLTKLPAKLNQFIFSGCEKVTLKNWSGKYKGVDYDEVWIYKIHRSYIDRFTNEETIYVDKREVYWKNGKFILEIGYFTENTGHFSAGYINYIRDRLYYESQR